MKLGEFKEILDICFLLSPWSLGASACEVLDLAEVGDCLLVDIGAVYRVVCVLFYTHTDRFDPLVAMAIHIILYDGPVDFFS